MSDETKTKISLETWLKVGLMSSLLISVIVIGLVSMNKETVFSPYEQDAEYSNLQLTEMRDDLGSGSVGYNISNTLATPWWSMIGKTHTSDIARCT